MIIKLVHKYCEAMITVEATSLKELWKNYDKKVWIIVTIEEA